MSHFTTETIVSRYVDGMLRQFIPLVASFTTLVATLYCYAVVA